MGRVIVITFTSIDGVMEDPDGSGGTPFGGWAMRHGPAAIAGDKFRLGDLMTDGVLLLGRRTWDHFGDLWSPRSTPFALAMNAAMKAVVTHRPIDVAHWANSSTVEGDLLEWVRSSDRDAIVIGSTSIVRRLQAADLVDEYRVLVFPTVLGEGARLFEQPVRLTLLSADQEGPATLTIYSTRE